MEMIAFASDGTKETTVKIINTLKQLGGVDCFNYKTDIQTHKKFMVGIDVENLYYFISETEDDGEKCGVIHCDSVLLDDYILKDIETFDINSYLNNDSYINSIISDNLPTTYDECPIIVQRLVDKKAEINNTIDLDAYANGALDCFNAINDKAYMFELLTDFKNHIGLLRGMQVLDSDINKFIESKKK